MAEISSGLTVSVAALIELPYTHANVPAKILAVMRLFILGLRIVLP
jgi:hypothetical protein